MKNTQDHSKKEFTPPRHWIGPEELEASYWNDPLVKEKRAQEFHDKPLETIELIEKLDTQGFARREFLTIMGASMAMATVACARRPVHKIIPHVIRPENVIPGVATYYASTCADTGCGFLVKTREGRPIKLEGNPDHPVNRGKLSVRDHAMLLDLYDTARIQQPFERNRTLGSKQDLSLEEFDQKVGTQLKAIAAKGGKVAVLSGGTTSDTTRGMIKEFLGAFAGSSYVEYEPLANDEIVAAQEESYGTSVIPHYRFDQADVVVSVGADFLGTWVSPVEFSVDWAKRRKLPKTNTEHATMSKVYSFEPNFSITGASADQRYNIAPGDEHEVLFAIANELIVNQKKSKYAADSAVTSLLSSHRPMALGIPKEAEVIRKIANELWEARGKSLVVAGGIQSKTRHSVGLQVMVNLLNSALENEGKTVDGSSSPLFPTTSSFAAVEKLMGELKSGVYSALILVKTNPAYTLPMSLGFEDAAKKTGLVIASVDRDNESAKFADFVVPETHFLESWNDSHPRKGLYSIQQPAIQPIHQSRSFQDSIIAWTKAGALAVKGSLAKATTWHDYILNHWQENQFKLAHFAGTFQLFWENCLRDGVFVEHAAASSSPRTFKTASFSKVRAHDVGGNGLRLSVYEKISMGDGASANNAWLQEMPDAITTSTWDNTANISPALAKEYNLSLDDVVEISFADGRKLELPVFIQPGLHPQTVAAAIGYGRTAVGGVGNGVGKDLYPFTSVENGVTVFSGQVIKLRKTGKVYRIAATQWHHTSENRPVINDITLADFKKNPSTTNHTDPHLKVEEITMWPVHEYKNYRWGMSIDLTSCTGCGACAVACQAENNIPTVGRDNVRVSRQMHWIRIDRYYSGTPENPDMIFQPMLCQHCENAPCETVCPVIATMHSSEGINDMIYNRCVGTRYCQNNCPYKVRRFNFFDHWKQYERTLNMVWNPDVTVRTRGIMEKCSFCIQRIRGAKDLAKDRGDVVTDADLKTACQQTCPTDAIVFGNVNNPKSKISEERLDPRTFRVLEVLNTKPAVSYLSKVRNKEAEGHSGHHE